MTERIVISLGGNAFAPRGENLTMAGQFEFAEKTLAPITSHLQDGTELLVTHGNGPQVGHILTRVEKAIGDAYRLPLEVCVAESEGELGYVLQQTLHNLCSGERSVVTVLTQVLVDRNDPAFGKPTKPIGPFLNAAAAKRLTDSGQAVAGDEARGFRRVVASPMPEQIVESDAIDLLLNSGVVVIAAGGGGIPVVSGPGGLEGIEAVVDKDFATALLARQLHADRMILVTGVPGAFRDYGTSSERLIEDTSAESLASLAHDGHFPSGSMGPKVDAIIEFARATGKHAAICQPSDLAAAIAMTAGTRLNT